MRKFLPLLIIATILVAGCGQASKKSPNDTAAEQAKQVAAKYDGMYQFKIITKFGTMTGVLYNETPIHRDNFIKLIGEDYYNGLLFHRIISGFMIQGGDPESKAAVADVSLGNGGPGYTLKAEINPQFIHKKGALAAARTGDFINPERESSGSQFYIVHGSTITQDMLDNAVSQGIPYTETQMAIYKKMGGAMHLDMQYTVFGEIIDGFDVIDAIAAVPKNHQDRPLENIIMKVELIKE